MKKLLAPLILALALAACGGTPDSADLETKQGASIIGQVWSTDGSAYTIRSASTYSCNGYTYKLVATYKQVYTFGPSYDWVDQIGDSSAAINGPVAGGKDVYLSCNIGPGNTSYGFPMYWGNDYYHLHNTNGLACKLTTAGSSPGVTLTTSIGIDGVYYTAYGFSSYPRGELLIHIASGPTGGFAGNGYCGPQYILMQL